jgi:hypothetical protein
MPRPTRYTKLLLKPKGSDANAIATVPLNLQKITNQTARFAEILDTDGETTLYAIDKDGRVALGGVADVLHGVTKTSLTAAQIIAMSVTPVAVTPTPASGQALVVDQIVVELNLSATAFTGGGVVHFYYDGASAEVCSATLAAATIQGGAGQSVFVLNPVATAGGSVVTKEKAIVITNATAAFADGTGTAKVFVSWRLITL